MPKQIKQEDAKAKRDDVIYRYDLLVPQFIEALAMLGSYGANKYGDRNWEQSRLTGGKGPVNHMYNHLVEFQMGTPHEFFGTSRGHLVAIAYNAMMEFFYNIPEDSDGLVEERLS